MECGNAPKVIRTFAFGSADHFTREQQLLKDMLKSKDLINANQSTKTDVLIHLHKQRVENEHGFRGAYYLETGHDINIFAMHETGLFYAIQTLRQMIYNDGETKMLNQCTIHDWPAFKYWGYMVDVGRNYQSITQLKEQIKVMPAYKMNKLHLHLTANPGWRISRAAIQAGNKP